MLRKKPVDALQTAHNESIDTSKARSFSKTTLHIKYKDNNKVEKQQF